MCVPGWILMNSSWSVGCEVFQDLAFPACSVCPHWCGKGGGLKLRRGDFIWGREAEREKIDEWTRCVPFFTHKNHTPGTCQEALQLVAFVWKAYCREVQVESVLQGGPGASALLRKRRALLGALLAPSRCPFSRPRCACGGLGLARAQRSRGSAPQRRAHNGRGAQSPARGRSGERGAAARFPQPLLRLGRGCGAAAAAGVPAPTRPEVLRAPRSKRTQGCGGPGLSFEGPLCCGETAGWGDGMLRHPVWPWFRAATATPQSLGCTPNVQEHLLSRGDGDEEEKREALRLQANGSKWFGGNSGHQPGFSWCF